MNPLTLSTGIVSPPSDARERLFETDRSFYEESEGSLPSYVSVQFLRQGRPVLLTRSDARAWGLREGRLPGTIEDAEGTFVLISLDSSPQFWVRRSALPVLELRAEHAEDQELLHTLSGSTDRLPDALKRRILAHYEGNILSEAVARELIRLREHFPGVLSVPARIRTAYRMMLRLPSSISSRMGIRGPNPVGWEEGGHYDPLRGKVGCWSSSLAMFQHHESLFSQIRLHSVPEVEASESWNVLLVADVASHRDQFLFNPQALPRVVGHTKYAEQQEVISVGVIPLRGIAYFQSSPSKEDSLRNLQEALSLVS